MSSRIVGIDGQALSAMTNPEQFRELRQAAEKRMQTRLEQFEKDIRTSAVVDADIPALRDAHDADWQKDCDHFEKKGLVGIKRGAFLDQVNASLAQIERRRKFTGPITPEALEMLGFTKWADGSYRTEEVTVEPYGKHWVIIGGMYRGDFTMANVIRFMDALDIKRLTPWMEEPNPSN